MTNQPGSSPLGAFFSTPLNVRGRGGEEIPADASPNFELVITGIYFEVWEKTLSDPFVQINSTQTVTFSAVSLAAVDQFLERLRLNQVTENGFGRFTFAASSNALESPLPTITNHLSNYAIPNIGGAPDRPISVADQPGNVTVPSGNVVPDNVFDLGALSPGAFSSLQMQPIVVSNFTNAFGRFTAAQTFASVYLTMNFGGSLSSTTRQDIALVGAGTSLSVPLDGYLTGKPLVWLRAV